jgi:hypothetical protein
VASGGFVRSCAGAMITSIDTHQIINKLNVIGSYSELSLPQPPRHHKVLVVVGALLRKYERSVPFFWIETWLKLRISSANGLGYRKPRCGPL